MFLTTSIALYLQDCAALCLKVVRDLQPECDLISMGLLGGEEFQTASSFIAGTGTAMNVAN